MEILEIIKELLTNTKGFLEAFVAANGLWIYGLLFLIVVRLDHSKVSKFLSLPFV
jgi:hypothetical protein